MKMLYPHQIYQNAEKKWKENDGKEESYKKPNLEEIKMVNLGSKENVKETRTSIHLEAEQKKKLIELLR